MKKWLYTINGEESQDPGFLRPRWGVWIALGLAGLGLLVGLGFFGYRMSAGWIERRNADRAQAFIRQQDYRRANLMLEQAVQINPASVSARRALAEFYDLTGNLGAVDRWREAVALAPTDEGLKLGLAASALKFGDLATLRTTLSSLAPSTRETLPYHRLGAALALAEGDSAMLVSHLEALVRLEPDNVRSRYSLTAVRLRSPQAEERAAAQTELEQLARGDQVRIAATLALWQALPAHDPNAVRSLAARVAPKGALKADSKGDFELIEHMKGQPNPSAEDAAALSSWMAVEGYARESLLWLRGLSAATRASPLVRASEAASAVRLQDWPLLMELILDGIWGHVGKDVVEQAFVAHHERQQGKLTQSRTTFGEAMKLATDSSNALWTLARLSAMWGWADEDQRVLWQITRDFPRDENAWRGLVARAEAEANTGKLVNVLQKRASARPYDLVAQADVLLLTVLCERADAAALSRARHALGAPESPVAEIAAGALVLAREGRVREGVRALDQAGEQRLRSAPRAGFVYGVLLSQAGRAEEGKKWLAPLAGMKLLPEEKALLTSAGGRPSEKG